MKKDVKYEVYLDGCNFVHISDGNGNGKLGRGIHNVSMLPGSGLLTKKDGSVLCNIPGTCAGCCEGCEAKCYAKNFTIRRHNTCIPAYADNTILATQDPESYWSGIQNYINNNVVGVFRFHVAGEIPNKSYLLKMCECAAKNPFVTFYVYTKRFSWIEEIVDRIPENLHILVSIWHGNYANPLGFAEFIYDDGEEPGLEKVPHCPAVDKNGHETGVTCARCKKCVYAKRGDRIAVYAH